MAVSSCIRNTTDGIACDHEANDGQIQIGDIYIDRGSQCVMRNGEPVVLTEREYAILEYLAIHRGEIVTRSALYQHLFGEFDLTLSNVIDVHIASLRKKLGHDLITTRRRQGYCVGC